MSGLRGVGFALLLEHCADRWLGARDMAYVLLPHVDLASPIRYHVGQVASRRRREGGGAAPPLPPLAQALSGLVGQINRTLNALRRKAPDVVAVRGRPPATRYRLSSAAWRRRQARKRGKK